MIDSENSSPCPQPTLRSGRGIVHCVGQTAGQIRVDFSSGGNTDAEDLQGHLRLELPGERELLRPVEVLEEDGSVIAGFFSADVANSGQLPSSMALHWKDGLCVSQVGPVAAESATHVRSEESAAAARAPGGNPKYPQTVGFVLALALGAAMLVGTAMVLVE